MAVSQHDLRIHLADILNTQKPTPEIFYSREKIDEIYDKKLAILDKKRENRQLTEYQYMYECRDLLDWYGKTLRIHGYSKV